MIIQAKSITFRLIKKLKLFFCNILKQNPFSFKKCNVFTEELEIQ